MDSNPRSPSGSGYQGSVCLPASVRLLIPLGAELVSELPRLGISALPVAAFELAEQIALAELIAAGEGEVVDLEAALGGGIRKAPGVIAVDEPEVAERTI